MTVTVTSGDISSERTVCLQTLCQLKIALSAFDDIRVILKDGIVEQALSSIMRSEPMWG